MPCHGCMKKTVYGWGKHIVIKTNYSGKPNLHKYAFFNLVLVEISSLTRKGIIRGVFLANHLASTDNLTRTTNTLKTEKNNTQYNKTFLIKDNTVEQTCSEQTYDKTGQTQIHTPQSC